MFRQHWILLQSYTSKAETLPGTLLSGHWFPAKTIRCVAQQILLKSMLTDHKKT